MNENALRNEIEEDLRLAPAKTVIYLEGTSDPIYLFALLGTPLPAKDPHQGVLVKGCKTHGGSGSTAVKNRVEVASRHNLKRVLGVVDGDGERLEILAPEFDAPHEGPLFSWKAYCIENLIAKTGWPKAWGEPIDWPAELSKYGCYVALNRIHRDLTATLETLDLAQFSEPSQARPLKVPLDVLAALEADKHRLQDYDVARRFEAELASFNTTLRSNMHEVHAHLNGKWLFKHLAPTITGRTHDRCQADWLGHARSVGGLPEIREWWERVTGSPP